MIQFWNYVNYLDKQAKLASKNNKTQEFPESKIEDFTAIKIPFYFFEDSNWEYWLFSLKNILCKTEYYVQIEVNEFVNRKDKRKCNYAKPFLFIWKIPIYFISSHFLKVVTELFTFYGSNQKMKIALHNNCAIP